MASHTAHQTGEKKMHGTTVTARTALPETHNRYDLLSEETNLEEAEGRTRLPQYHKPPPVFIHGVINYDEMVKLIRDVAEGEQYYTKSLANNVIKLNCMTPETYRNFIKYFKKTIYITDHTY